MRESNTCPLEKAGFSIIFAKDWPAKKIFPPEISTSSDTTLSVQLKNNRMDPTKVILENGS